MIREGNKKIAIIADIHANSLALEAVLDDIENLNIAVVINLGDSLYGPLEPMRTYSMIKQSGMISISGNMDRYLIDRSFPDDNPTMQFILNDLDSDAKKWLNNIPSSIRYGEHIFGCHGTPVNDEEPMLECIQLDFITTRSDTELASLLQGISENIILCAHTHVQRAHNMACGKLIINPGSVGLPSYSDNLPYPHKMESGTPYAKYCVIDMTDQGLATYSFRQVKYDWVSASSKARLLGREDWSHSLLFGTE